MKVDHPEKRLLPISFWAPASPSGVDDRLNKPAARIQDDEGKLSYWQLVLLQSKANGCSYHGEDLPQVNWEWPKNTWFQERLRHHLRSPGPSIPA